MSRTFSLLATSLQVEVSDRLPEDVSDILILSIERAERSCSRIPLHGDRLVSGCIPNSRPIVCLHDRGGSTSWLSPQRPHAIQVVDLLTGECLAKTLFRSDVRHVRTAVTQSCCVIMFTDDSPSDQVSADWSPEVRSFTYVKGRPLSSHPEFFFYAMGNLQEPVAAFREEDGQVFSWLVQCRGNAIYYPVERRPRLEYRVRRVKYDPHTGQLHSAYVTDPSPHHTFVVDPSESIKVPASEYRATGRFDYLKTIKPTRACVVPRDDAQDSSPCFIPTPPDMRDIDEWSLHVEWLTPCERYLVISYRDYLTHSRRWVLFCLMERKATVLQLGGEALRGRPPPLSMKPGECLLWLVYKRGQSSTLHFSVIKYQDCSEVQKAEGEEVSEDSDFTDLPTFSKEENGRKYIPTFTVCHCILDAYV